MSCLLVIKSLLLFNAVLWTIINLHLLKYKQAIPGINFIVQATGITGFIVLQWLI